VGDSERWRREQDLHSHRRCEVDHLEAGLHRPDVAYYYWFLPGAEHSGFRGVHRLRAMPAAHWTIEYVDRDTGKAIEPWHTFYIDNNDLLDGVPVPSLPQIHRVHGGNSPNQFLIEGSSTYVKFERALAMVTGRRFADFGTILDFGCGCGRLARYFTIDPAHRLVGVDIDGENVDWCRANLAGDFLVNSREPPLPFEPASVDCVVANDVFNHFREATGAPGSESSPGCAVRARSGSCPLRPSRRWARAHLSAGHDAQIRALDFVDLSRNPELDAVIEDQTYYRNVFPFTCVCPCGVAPEGFAILGIIPGVSGNHNDLVILRKR
jgi:SAM-dependent methyltransferase